MKIRDIKTFVVGNRSIHRGGPYWVFVRVTTDTGIKGYGEIYGVAFHPKALVQAAKDKWGRVDIFVANAAVNPVYGPLSALEDAAFQKVMTSNVHSLLWFAKSAMPLMAEQGDTTIVGP